jgi:hypothetical protein
MDCAAVYALFAAAGTALAQQGPPVPEYRQDEGGAPASEERRPEASFSLFTNYAFPSDFDDAPGDVSIWRAGGMLDVSIPVRERDSVIVSFGTEFSSYDFDTGTSIAGTNEPWDDVLENFLLVSYRARVHPQWTVLAGAGANASYQSGADFGESVTFLGKAVGLYHARDGLSMGLGVLVSSRLEEDVIAIPFPVIDWSVSDKWSVRTGGSMSGRGWRIEVGWQATETFSLSLGTGLEAREFRLDDAGPIPDGVGRDWRAPASLVANWKPVPQVTLRAEVGAIVFQNFAADDSTGAELADVDADPTVFIGLGASLGF